MIWDILCGMLLIALPLGYLVWRKWRVGPEVPYRIESDDVGITAISPSGERRQVAWSDLTRIAIRTTSGGPLEMDVFWGFHTKDRDPAFAIPGDANGVSELLRALDTRLVGFRHDEVVRAMASTSNAFFVVWELSSHASPTSAAASAA